MLNRFGAAEMISAAPIAVEASPALIRPMRWIVRRGFPWF
jgi:hypothetical protein